MANIREIYRSETPRPSRPFERPLKRPLESQAVPATRIALKASGSCMHLGTMVYWYQEVNYDEE
jgi:hypothetical protein